MDADRSMQIGEGINGSKVSDRAQGGDGIESQSDLYGGYAGGAGLRHPASQLGTHQRGAVEAHGLHPQTHQHPLARVR